MLSADPQAGDALDQLGDVQHVVPLDLDQSGGGQSGGAALVYNADGVHVRPVIQATLQSPTGSALPSTISAVLTWNGMAGATLTYSTSGLHQGDPVVLAAQVPDANYVSSTGRYSWSLHVVASGTFDKTASGVAYVVTQDNSPFGSGWTFGPTDRLYSIAAGGSYPAGMLRAYGTGEWRFYSGTSTFTSMPEDNGTLTLSAGVYTYSTPDGQTWTFNSSGYETNWSSADGQEQLGFTYSGGNLATMTAIDGTTTTFTYSGGQVSTIVTGNGRTTSLAYAGSNLTQVTDPDGGAPTYSYDSNHHLTGQTFANLQDGWAYGSGGALGTLTWGGSGSLSLTGYVPAVVRGLPGSAARGPVSATATDPVAAVTTLTLDVRGRALVSVAGDGGVATITRDPQSGFVWAVTDALGRRTAYQRDAAGYVVAQTNPDGSVRSDAYQSNFHALVASTDEGGATTRYAYDASGHLTKLTDALGVVTTLTYLSNGLVQSQIDPLGRGTTYAYDTLRRLTAVTGPLGDVTSTAYDANGYPQTTTDALGRVTTALFDVMGRPTGTIDALGQRTTATYNAAGLELTSTDALGRQTTTAYDSSNRGLVAQAIDAIGTAATDYDAAGRVSQSRNRDGWATTYGYDAAGRQTRVTDALGGVSLTRYDLAGEVTATQDPLGAVTATQYDLRGRATQTTDAAGGVSGTAYDLVGNAVSQTDALGHTGSTAYDQLGRVTRTTDPTGAQAATSYDAAGQVAKATDALGHVTSYAYDGGGRQTSVTEAAGTAQQRTTTTAYDLAGHVTRGTDALGGVTTYAYDLVYRQTAVTDPLNHVTSTAYDAVGNATARTDALGKVTTTAYDAGNRATQTTDPLGHTNRSMPDPEGHVVRTFDGVNDVRGFVYDELGREIATFPNSMLFEWATFYGYDARGDRTLLTDPVRNTTTWVYDTLGRAVKQTDPLGHVTTTAYYATSEVSSVTDALGRLTISSYDAAGRETAVDWRTAGPALPGARTNRQVFTYDAAGQQLTAADSSGTYSNSYDALGRLTAQTGPFGVALTYMYDANSRQTTAQDSLGGTTTSVYDTAGRLTTRELGGPSQTPLRLDLGYDNRDALTGLTRWSNLAGTSLVGTTSYAYDAAGRATGVVSKNASLATVSYYNYQYDNADRVTLASGTGATGTYSYDNESEVLGDGTATYSCDASGNRAMSGYHTGTDNQVTRDGTWTYTYDAVGNLTQKPKGSGQETWNYSYDNANHLVSAQQTNTGSNVVVTYTYDVYGQRVEEDKKQGSGSVVVTRFVWSGSQVVMDLNGSNVVQERYLWGDAQDQLFARVDGNGTAWWYLTDRLGSVRDVLSASGSASDHTDYTAYGVIISQSGASAQGRFCWTSKDFDAQTGLQYNLARYYSPAAGTWTSEDPLGFGAGDSNLYRYCGNGPTNATDPSGLDLLYIFEPEYTIFKHRPGKIFSLPGHGALMVYTRDSDKQYYYFSYSTGVSKKTSDDNLTQTKYKSIDDFLKDPDKEFVHPDKYKFALYWKTDTKQDKRAMDYMRYTGVKTYRLFFHNCGMTAMNSILFALNSDTKNFPDSDKGMENFDNMDPNKHVNYKNPPGSPRPIAIFNTFTEGNPWKVKADDWGTFPRIEDGKFVWDKVKPQEGEWDRIKDRKKEMKQRMP